MSETTFSFKDEILELTSQDGKTIQVKFRWPVDEVLDMGTIFVVLIEPIPGAKENENVFGVGHDGAIVWTIAKRKYRFDDSPFVGITQENDSVRLNNWDGTILIVAPRTGEVLHKSWTK